MNQQEILNELFWAKRKAKDLSYTEEAINELILKAAEFGCIESYWEGHADGYEECARES